MDYLNKYLYSDIKIYAPLKNLYDYVQEQISSGAKSIKLFDRDVNNQIVVDENNKLIKLIIDFIKALVPGTENMTYNEILNLFESRNLNQTLGIILTTLLDLMCKLEGKLPDWLKKQLGITEETQKEDVQKGGFIYEILAILICLVCICLCILIVLVIVLLLCIVVGGALTIIAVVVLIAVCLIVVLVIQISPTLIAIYRTKGKILTELSIDFFQTYEYDRSNTSVKNLIRVMLDAFSNYGKTLGGITKNISDLSTQRIMEYINGKPTNANDSIYQQGEPISVEEVGSQYADQQTEQQIDQQGGGDGDGDNVNIKIKNICDLNNLLKSLPLDQIDVDAIEDKFYDLKETDMHGILYLFRYPVIFGYVILLHEKLWLDPIKNGELPILNPTILIDMFKSSLNPTEEEKQKLKSDEVRKKREKLMTPAQRSIMEKRSKT